MVYHALSTHAALRQRLATLWRGALGQPVILATGLAMCTGQVRQWTVGGGVDGAGGWALSGQALREGRIANLAAHLFTHSSVAHLAVNLVLLMATGAVARRRCGNGVGGALRLAGVLMIAAAGGAAFYLAANAGRPGQAMLGASAMIFGLIGFLARIRRGGTGDFAGRPAWLLFGLLHLPAVATGRIFLTAWEAHLGGFLAGFCLAPLLLPAMSPGQAPPLSRRRAAGRQGSAPSRR